MYSRSYNTSNRVPVNYGGTSIKAEEPEVTEEAVEVMETTEPAEPEEYLLDNRPYARVPLMEKPKYKPVKPPVVIDDCKPIDSEKPKGKPPAKKISADDILLIGLLIVLLGCENVDLKLIIAVAALLFAGF